MGLVYFTTFGGEPARLLPANDQTAYGSYAIEGWLARWISGLGIPLTLFVLGLLLFELFVTAVLVRRMSAFFELHIQPDHPDRCGGFKAIGDLCIKMVYVVLAPTLFISFWLVVSKHVDLDPELQILLPPYVLNPGFRTPMKVLLTLLVMSGVTVFSWPMYTVHRLMLAERVGLQQTLDGIARRIHQLHREVLADPASMSACCRSTTISASAVLVFLLPGRSQQSGRPVVRTTSRRGGALARRLNTPPSWSSPRWLAHCP